MNPGWVIFMALMFLSFFPHPYFKQNPNVREVSRFGLFLFLSVNIAMIGVLMPNALKVWR